MSKKSPFKFTGYQFFVIGLLTFFQFTIVLDFMILSPLGVMVLADLQITTAQFGLVVSVYALSAVVGVFTAIYLRPIRDHLLVPSEKNAVVHLLSTIREPRYLYTFGATSILAGPLIGRLSDAIGKYNMFCIGSVLAIGILLYYTRLGTSSLQLVILINSTLFIGITARMVSASALTSAVPLLKDRGAFMAINSSLQQLSGGVAAFAAGLIVHQTPSGELIGYPILGFVVSIAIVITVVMLFKINKMVHGTN